VWQARPGHGAPMTHDAAPSDCRLQARLNGDEHPSSLQNGAVLRGQDRIRISWIRRCWSIDSPASCLDDFSWFQSHASWSLVTGRPQPLPGRGNLMSSTGKAGIVRRAATSRVVV
jgi:hypothetical protein